MTELYDIARENDVNLENCVVFVVKPIISDRLMIVNIFLHYFINE